eukprot:8405994-Lingulodinium_polyedra.AAC.1
MCQRWERRGLLVGQNRPKVSTLLNWPAFNARHNGRNGRFGRHLVNRNQPKCNFIARAFAR